MKKSPPPGHQILVTEDGSRTFFSEAFQEACHSATGARTETLLHYINGCKLQEKIREHDPLMILEVGFGLGVGFLTTFDHLPRDRKWKFISLELDRNLLEWFKEEYHEHEFLKDLRWEKNLLRCSSPHVELIILQGDARVALPEFLKENPFYFHAIYQDPFSPKRNPVLWTKEWFTLLKNASHPEVTLSTYSASTSIRKSLYEAGWSLQKGDMFGSKRSSTRAYLKGTTDPDLIFQMERSPANALSDLNISSFLETMKK